MTTTFLKIIASGYNANNNYTACYPNPKTKLRPATHSDTLTISVFA